MNQKRHGGIFGIAAFVGAAGMAMAQGPGLAHRWTFNGHGRDSIAKAHATLLKGADTIHGQLKLDGIDDYARVAPQASIGFTKAYTVHAWIRSIGATNTYRVVFIRGAGSANDVEVYIQAVSNHLIVAHNRGNGGTFDFVGFVPPPAKQRVHVAVTFDGRTARAYYDGIEQATAQRNRSLVQPRYTAKPLEVGRTLHPAFGQHRSHFAGEIDEVRIHDRALSAFWVKLLYRIGTVPAGEFTAFGRPCGGTLSPSLEVPANVSPAIGYSFPIQLRSKSLKSAAFLLTGASKSSWRRGRLPLDLGTLAPGCKLYTSTDVVTVVTTDNAGRATKTVPVPNDSRLGGVVFHNQWLLVAPAINPLGIVLSNAGTIRIGYP